MAFNRRTFLDLGGRFALASSAWGLLGEYASAATERVAISVPGPGNLLFLPIAIAKGIGADQAEGLDLDVRYIGGGPQAYREMLDRNTDFSAGGMAALALQRLSGKPVVCIAPLTRVPAYTLLVRNNLKSKVKTISDLAGKVVGVKGHVPGGRSTSQLFTEYVLTRSGVSPGGVNYVSVGQAYENQHAALVVGAVDAIMGDEPFATRLVKQKAAYALADYHDIKSTRELLGGLFLNGQVATREDFVAKRPDVVDKVVKALKRTLVWIDNHSAREMVDALALPTAEEREALFDVLKLRKNVYSPNGRFSAEQLATVDHFLHATETSDAARAFSVTSIVLDRWAGKGP